MESYAHKGIIRAKSKIYDRAFITSVKPYFKNALNSIELPLLSIFCTTYLPFREKTYNCENIGRKSLLLTMEQSFFFKNQNYALASSVKVF